LPEVKARTGRVAGGPGKRPIMDRRHPCRQYYRDKQEIQPSRQAVPNRQAACYISYFIPDGILFRSLFQLTGFTSSPTYISCLTALNIPAGMPVVRKQRPTMDRRHPCRQK